MASIERQYGKASKENESEKEKKIINKASAKQYHRKKISMAK